MEKKATPVRIKSESGKTVPTLPEDLCLLHTRLNSAAIAWHSGGCLSGGTDPAAPGAKSAVPDASLKQHRIKAL